MIDVDLNATISYQGWDTAAASARFEQTWKDFTRLEHLYYDVDVNATTSYQGWDAGAAPARFEQTWGGGDELVQPCRSGEAEE